MSEDKLVNEDKVIQLLQNRTDSNIPYKPINEVSRTIVLFGRTRTGKTTIVNVLNNPLYIPPPLELYSKTKEVEIHQIGSFQVVDSPGFFDRQTFANRNQKLTNDTIKSYLDDYLEHSPGVHLFAFVFSLSAGINNDDIQSMLFIMQNYPRLSEHVVLIVTNCEERDDKNKAELVDGFFSHEDIIQYNLRNFFKQGVLFMGCLRREAYEANNGSALRKQYDNVLKMRTQFIEKCLQCMDVYMHGQTQAYIARRPSSEQTTTRRPSDKQSQISEETGFRNFSQRESSCCDRFSSCISWIFLVIWHCISRVSSWIWDCCTCH